MTSVSQSMIERLLLEGAIAPKDITGAAQTGDWFSLKGCQRALVVIVSGAWAGGTSAITLEQATDNAAGGAKALGFTRYWTKTTSTGASVFEEQAAASDTFNVSAANTMHVIEVDAADLDVDGDFCYIRAKAGSPGSNADLLAIFYIGGNVRYPGDPEKLVDPKA